MKIDILCVGKIKEKFYRDALDEYKKRLSRYATLNIIEVADEKTPDNASENVIDGILSKEAERLLKYIPDATGEGTDTYVITLEIKGKQLTSEQLAKQIESLGINGVSHLIFIIGGSLGLHNSVISRSNYHLSFSPMTFPHQLMRVILLEQIYRSYRIINHEPYHK
ncbi:23S rRNA (pseudouridine1915-N3)-methyltransferase [Lachnospiraceae bacterium NE2001]|nr:23S rRNA (pseudouridine1915-N3)-methyltransferase [Lachnospiraceae bacterium NE2001]